MKEREAAGSLERLPSGRHDIPRDVVIRSQRTRILAAVAECSAERGYAATTVGQVVQRAGVSSATFYELFRDKEDCFLAAVRDIMAEALTVVSVAYGRDKPDLELLRDGIVALLEMMAAEPARAKVVFLECRASTPRALDLYLSGARAVISVLSRGWGAAPPDRLAAATAARAVLGGAEAIVRKEIATGRTERLPEALPGLLYCALVPFLGQEAALRQARAAREAGGTQGASEREPARG